MTMWYFNLTFNSFFDLLLIPFRSLHPLWSLSILSLLMGILMLMIYRYTSNQKEIKETKNRIKAHLLEIRLFKDDFGILLSAQKNILLYNTKYMMHALKPMLFMIVPVAIILIHLDGWFGYRPLTIGESTAVSVKVSGQEVGIFSDIVLEVDRGLVIETPALRIPELSEITWRVRAKELGQYNVIIKVSGHPFTKRVVVSDRGLTRVSPRVVASSLWEMFLNPGEKPLPENSFVKQIEVYYPDRLIGIFGWEIHWIVIFFVLSILGGFTFKGFFRVEI